MSESVVDNIFLSVIICVKIVVFECNKLDEMYKIGLQLTTKTICFMCHLREVLT